MDLEHDAFLTVDQLRQATSAYPEALASRTARQQYLAVFTGTADVTDLLNVHLSSFDHLRLGSMFVEGWSLPDFDAERAGGTGADAETGAIT
jgi:hypothetical protein